MQAQKLDRKDILVDRRYLAIRPYLSSEAQSELVAQHVVASRDPYGVVGSYYLDVIRKEADRLAREWDV